MLTCGFFPPHLTGAGDIALTCVLSPHLLPTSEHPPPLLRISFLRTARVVPLKHTCLLPCLVFGRIPGLEGAAGPVSRVCPWFPPEHLHSLPPTSVATQQAVCFRLCSSCPHARTLPSFLLVLEDGPWWLPEVVLLTAGCPNSCVLCTCAVFLAQATAFHSPE